MTIKDIKAALAARANLMNLQPVAPAASVKPSTPATKKTTTTTSKKPAVTAKIEPVTTNPAPVKMAPPVPMTTIPAQVEQMSNSKLRNSSKTEATIQAISIPMKSAASEEPKKITRRTKRAAENTLNPLEIEAIIKMILVPGRDYGQIRGFTKPCLFKSGAERLLAYFGFTTRTELVSCTELWQDNFVAYTVKVTVMDKNGNELGNGYGECNSRERRFAKSSVYDAANCAIKLSVKRGMCDAALRVCGASSFLAQDEDTAVEPRQEAGNDYLAANACKRRAV